MKLNRQMIITTLLIKIEQGEREEV